MSTFGDERPPATAWFLSRGGAQSGPFTLADLEGQAVDAHTLAWTDGMADWEPAGRLPDLADLLARSAGGPGAPPRIRPPSEAPRQLIRSPPGAAASLRRRFRLLLGTQLAWLAVLVAGRTGILRGLPAVFAPVEVIVFCLLIVTAFIIELVQLHALWSVIEGFTARTSPERAVGFCFIPFFNAYWVTVAFFGLAADLKEAMRRADVAGRPPSLVLAGITTGALYLIGIPYVGILALVLLLFFMWQVTRAGIALAEAAR